MDEAFVAKTEPMGAGAALSLVFIGGAVTFGLRARTKNKELGKTFWGAVAKRAEAYAALRERDDNDYTMN
jgi:hypothetical protein